MACYYFDASALVKYYVTEPGSSWVRQLVEEREPETQQVSHVIFVAEITRVEVAAGLAIIERVGGSGGWSGTGNIADSPASSHIGMLSFR